MRVMQSMYYDSIYGTNNNKLTNELFDVNKQIASGLKIQYASDDVRTFSETMRLDNEVATLGQIKKSTDNGYKVSNQSDTILNDFTTSLDRTKTLFVQAANGSQSDQSLDAIANELRGLEDHFKNLANTSINGQYLFSGSAVGTKPISDDGIYHGNDQSMNALIGSNNTQQYNLTGAELFLGEEVSQNREITSNTINRNILADYPNLQATGDNTESMLTSSDSMRTLMGDIDAETDPENTYHFYLRGTRSDGSTFKDSLTFTDTDTIDNLLTKIGEAYGNNGNLEVVNVSLNNAGEIVVEDKLNGSSKLDFHLVGAVDFDTTDGNDEADINDAIYANPGAIDNLDGGETNFTKILDGSNDLYVKEFVKSDLNVDTTIQGLTYDKTEFSKDGSKLSANVPQVLKKTQLVDVNGVITDTIPKEKENSFAEPSTKISEVANAKKEIVPNTDPKTYTLDGTVFDLKGVDIEGNAYSVTINLNSDGSTFSPDGGVTNYKIFDMGDPRDAVAADDMTYQQLMDVMNMVVTNSYPASEDNADDYDNAISLSNEKGSTSLSYDGKLEFLDLTASNTQAIISLADSNAGNFDENASVMTFNTTNALTIRDPKTDFFKTLDEAIAAVEEHKLYPDASIGTTTNIGIENAIQMIDDLSEHVTRSQAKVGAQSNALNNSLERTSLLEVSTVSLRSSVIDTDLAEASLRLTQLDTNYQAMLSTVGKVSKLSLVNYL